MSVNDKQVGGTHYKHQSYQHWDFAVDMAGNDAYLKGCASKYVIRYKDKNGLEDLRKALHYIDKIEEVHCPITICDYTYNILTRKRLKDFVSQLEPTVGQIVTAIYYNELNVAREGIRELISDFVIQPKPTVGKSATAIYYNESDVAREE